MRVLSLFDGISCARVALERAGIEVDAYYASEIDKHAIAISKKNYPDIIQLGSVVGLTPPEGIDFLIGGSPCQDLSIAKKDRKGLDGDRSGLFWEYVRIKEECNPTYFVLENVASMPKKDMDLITITLGVRPILFNASLVSAQCRKRLFWTNLKFELPEDRGILLKHILQPDGEVNERIYDMSSFHKTPQTDRNETKKLGYVGEFDHQAKRVYDDNGKLPALNVVCNSMVKVGYIGEGEQYGQGGQAHRVYSPEGKTPTLSSSGPLVKLGHIGNSDSQGNRVYDPSGKSCTLSANGGGLGAKTGLYKTDDRIRKLTPIECERLQSLPDNYTEGIAKTNRYKCLGNAFNVEVVAHILRSLV
jgi:DNA (cytosine-5)-methyltransferase 3A